MGFAPLLHALDIFLAPEVIPVGRFREPAALTGSFAGAAALRFGTIGLMIGVAVLGSEELLATTALAMIGLWTHDSGYGVTRKNLNRPSPKKRHPGRRKKTFAKFPKKTHAEEDGISNRQEFPSFISPLTSMGPQTRK